MIQIVAAHQTHVPAVNMTADAVRVVVVAEDVAVAANL